MFIPILQVVLTITACLALWRFARRFDRRDVTARIIVAGFLVRAFGAQLLFWISWLRLPLGRSLQIGNGLWFFAMDGDGYLRWANELLAKGAKAIVTIDATYPSHVFVQLFTLCTAAFGVVASTAILLNCAAYLATCALILRVAPPAAERARAFAIAAVALGPASILWSLQPLKDTVFVLLITLLIALGHEWQALWRAAPRPSRAITCIAALCVTVYAIAGTRWYVGAMSAAALFVFLPLVANVARPRLVPSAAAAAVVFLVGSAFLIGGDGDIPPSLRHALDGSMLLKTRVETPANLLAATRRGFGSTPGATTISPGTALLPAKTSASVITAKKPSVVTTSRETAVRRPPTVTAEPQALPAASTPRPAVERPPVAAATTAPPPPAPEPAPAATASVTPVAEPRAPAPVVVEPRPSPTEPHAERPTATVAAVPTTTAAPKTAPPPESVRKPTRRAAQTAKREKTVTMTTPAPALLPRPVVVAPTPAPPPPPRPQPTLAANITTGIAAMFLPRAVAQRAGLVQIGGGRGFWLFADAETVVFDAVLLIGFGYSLRRLVGKRARVTPLFVLVALLFVALCGPMTYTVTNFGTLFRLREMLYILAALLPVTLDLPQTAR